MRLASRSILLLWLAFASVNAWAVTYYVATTGSDTNLGTLGAPFRTVQHAVDLVHPGDIIELRAGTYNEHVRVKTQGTLNAWITLRPFAGEHAHLHYTRTGDADENSTLWFSPGDWPNDCLSNQTPATCPPMYWRVEGLELTGGYYVIKFEAGQVKLINNDIHGSSFDLIKLVQNANDVTIYGNEIHDVALPAPYTWDNPPLTQFGDVTINAQGIDMLGADRVWVAYNHVYNIPTLGVYAKGNARETVFENNRIENVYNQGIMLGQSSDPAFLTDGNYETYDGIIRNNIIRNTKGACLAVGSSWNAKVYNNSCYNVAAKYNGGIYITNDQFNSLQPSTHVEIKNNIIVMARGEPNQRSAVQVTHKAMTDDTTLHVDNNIYWHVDGQAAANALPFYWERFDEPGKVQIGPTVFADWKAQTAQFGYPQDPNSLIADPLYISLNDLAIPTNSPAVNRGENIGCPVTDFLSRSNPDTRSIEVRRPVGICDIGAYEVGAAAPPPQSCSTVSPDAGGVWGWANTPIAAQTGSFTAEWDATPLNTGMDALMSLTAGPQTVWTGLAAIVRFNDVNAIDARNGGAYTAGISLPYTANQTYHFRVAVNVPTHTYSVYVTPAGGVEQLLAANYAFRTEQQGVTQLDNWNLGSGAGSLRACNLVVRANVDTPPSVAITAPTNGATVNGTISLAANATDNVAVAGVQFIVDNVDFGAEDTMSPYTLPLDTLGLTNGTHTISARARDTAGNVSTAGTVTITVNNMCQTVSAGLNGTWNWANTPIAAQAGSFTAEWDGVPLTLDADVLMALTSGPQTTWTGLAGITRFATPNIDARNGGVYTAAAVIPYTPNTSYHFRLAVSVPTHTYSTFVTPSGGSELVVGQGFAFRTEQQGVGSLDNWNLGAGTGSLKACNLRISSP